jgi:hypothetical protein
MHPAHWNECAQGRESDAPAVLHQLQPSKSIFYITWQPIITANWEASSGNVWTVPFGGGLGRIMKFGNQPVSLSASFYGNAKYPRFGSPWSASPARLSVSQVNEG